MEVCELHHFKWEWFLTMKEEYYQMGTMQGEHVSFDSLDDILEERGDTTDHGGWSLINLRKKFSDMGIEDLYTKYCDQLRRTLLSLLCLMSAIYGILLIVLSAVYKLVSVFFIVFVCLYVLNCES